jgi:iron complex outermembrane receptor protein
VWEPTTTTSVAIDLWNVEIRDQVSSVSEGLIFQNPAKYANLFTTKHIASTGLDVLAIKLLPINIGKVENRGIDYDFTQKIKLFDGRLTNRLAGTYLLRSRYTTPGTDDQWETSLNRYGSNDQSASATSSRPAPRGKTPVDPHPERQLPQRLHRQASERR